MRVIIHRTAITAIWFLLLSTTKANNVQNPNAPLVVRPLEVAKPVLNPAAITSLTPVDAPCSCRTSVVKPAVLPKPASTTQQTAYGQQPFLFPGPNYARSSNVLFTSPDSRSIFIEDVVQRNPTNPLHNIPADPVSLAVAFRQAQEDINYIKHLEDKLSFGFRTLPREIPARPKQTATKVFKSIPEENLFNLNGHIFELQKVKHSTCKSLDEEAADELLALAEESEELAEVSSARKIGFGDIGYAPASMQRPAFVNVQLANPEAAAAEAAAAAAAYTARTVYVPPRNDGFKPGDVVISQVPKASPLSVPIPFPEPCPEGEENQKPGNPLTQLMTSLTYPSLKKNKAATHMIIPQNSL